MKYLFYLFLFFSLSLNAQIWEDNLKAIIKNPTVNERSNAFEKHRKINNYTKGNGFKPYARKMDFLLDRSSKHFAFQPHALYFEWLKQKKHPYLKNHFTGNWVAKGPINTPIILSNGKKRGNGRVNCIAFDPIDTNIVWIGSPAGGLWKSIDDGNSWSTETDNLPVIGVSHIAIDPTNSNTMYIVTGDANGSDTYSIGILKSTDAGITWDTTGLSYNLSQEITVNKIIINPNYPDSLFAATNSNLMLSIDGGVTWNSIGLMGRWRDLEFKPNNPFVIYAAKQSSGGSNVYRSIDGGGSWNVIDNGVASTGKHRPLIAVTPSNPNVIYALYSSADYGFHGLYKSSDAGGSWDLQSDSPNILGRATDGTGTGGQSWYDLSLGVSPENENLIYVGGINLWKSIDGGVSWDIDASSGNSSYYSYMHVDQHILEFSPHTNIAYAGNDGGIYKYMENLNKWVDISDGLEISQFYNLGLSKTNSERIIAGAQDNGTELLTNQNWDAIMGGDGMECMIDHYDENILYAEYQYGGLRKSYNGGNNWDNIKPVSYEGGWNTPYKMHDYNNNLIVIGYDEVYRSTTAGAAWDSISYNITNGQAIKFIALAPSNESYIYAGTHNMLKMTSNAGVSWENIKPGLPSYNITDITVANNNANKIWVTLSGYNNTEKVYESLDGGVNWTNISGSNLPGIPANCIVHQANTNDALYIGTDLGVYYKNNSMSEWIPYMNGLPNVIVTELEIHYGDHSISASTYGRGVWKSPLNTTNYTSNFSDASLNIYPNPAKEKIFVSATSSVYKTKTSIYNLIGELMLEVNSREVDVSNLTSGCYIVKVLFDDKKTTTRKLIIE